MSNLKKPIFWAYIVLMAYALFQLVFVLAFGPFPSMAKVFLGILGFLCCIVIWVFVVIFFRRPIPSDNIFWSFSPLPIGLLGLVQTGLGSLSLFSLLDALPLKFDGAWEMYMHIGGAVMLPIGILISIFSALQLISNRKSK